MTVTPLTIWTNAKFADDVTRALHERITPHRLIYATATNASNLSAAPVDVALAEADIAFGQPDAKQIQATPRLRWVHLTSAGYTAYDKDEVRQALQSRGARLTTSSDVYDEPCAQHAVAMMLALARQLPMAQQQQAGDHDWPQAGLRERSHLLNGQTALLVGYGAIATRLSQLLAPFEMKLIGVRRQLKGDETIPMVTFEQLNEALPLADHVINILPANDSTMGLFDAARFACCKRGAWFYNIGRGVTVNQEDLLIALQSGQLGAAYLDVTEPEPLPPAHPLWSAPNCYITPHTAGGDAREFWHVIEHFLANLKRYEQEQPLRNQVI
jgi:phosphoglycerate dehydrogenase-like enzyme